MYTHKCTHTHNIYNFRKFSTNYVAGMTWWEIFVINLLINQAWPLDFPVPILIPYSKSQNHLKLKLIHVHVVGLFPYVRRSMNKLVPVCVQNNIKIGLVF
jgi:hypothetical protein